MKHIPQMYNTLIAPTQLAPLMEKHRAISHISRWPTEDWGRLLELSETGRLRIKNPENHYAHPDGYLAEERNSGQ